MEHDVTVNCTWKSEHIKIEKNEHNVTGTVRSPRALPEPTKPSRDLTLKFTIVRALIDNNRGIASYFLLVRSRAWKSTKGGDYILSNSLLLVWLPS